MVDSHGRFVWYELMTTDTAAAKAFYGKVLGWGVRNASIPGSSYALFIAGEAPVSGLVDLPEAARRTGAEPKWIGYVEVDDVDATAERIKRLGGAVHIPPTDVPNISRFSIVTDPQMATLALFKWREPRPEQPAALSKPGQVGWHELFAADWEKAFAFYAELFGWQKVNADIDEMGTYLLFAAAGQTIGGMFTKPPMVPEPFWLYYFNVADVDAAAKRVKAGGGRILEGPLAMPDGRRVARCTDPQGAMFALTGQRDDKTIGYFPPVTSNDPSATRFFVRR